MNAEVLNQYCKTLDDHSKFFSFSDIAPIPKAKNVTATEVKSLGNIRPLLAEKPKEHVQKYRGFTLYNDIDYTAQMQEIDCWKDAGFCDEDVRDFLTNYCLAPQSRSLEVKKPKEEKQMNTVTINEVPQLEKIREHFINRLYQARSEHDSKLEEHFGLKSPRRPRTYKALLEKITSGDIRIRDGYKEDKDYGYTDPFELIHWTKKEKDDAGYQAAYEKLSIAAEQTKDQFFAIQDTAKFPGVLHDFAGKTFH